MEASSLDSVLSGEVAAPQTTTPPVEQAVQEVDKGETTTGETSAPPAEPQKDDPLEKHRKGLEAAATAERQRRQAAEARADAAERRAQALEQQQRQAQQPPQQQQADPNEPKREEYASDTDYIRALARHEAKAMREAEKADEKRAQAEAQQLEMLNKTEPIYAKAMALPGFNREAFDHFLTNVIANAVFDSDDSARLMHHLGANLGEMQRIAQLSPGKQARELARIEDQLAAPAEGESDEDDPKPKKPLPDTLTQARNAKGRFEPVYSGPTPLNAILK